MQSSQAFSKLGFARSYVLPLFVVFLIPAFGLWFFGHAEKHFDQQFLAQIEASIAGDESSSQEEKDKALEFFREVPVSRILASNHPEARDTQAMFEGMSFEYATFRWMKRIAFVCLLTTVVSSIAVGIGVALSFRSQLFQYWSLQLGWYVLRLFAVVQVLGQGALAVALSYWMTALWMERYYVKLIALVGILAVVAAGLIVAAVFKRPRSETRVAGRVLAEKDAPMLWERVRGMAAKLGTAPPDQIVVGIDDNFFVTEHSVTVGKEVLRGRTLFASLSLLRVLTRDEADAVLGHEMAHFSGDDTLYSRKISPLLQKYGIYLQALHDGGISRPVFHYMVFFWSLYQFSLRKLSRLREFRADRIGAELSSSRGMAGALVKIAAYCKYRASVQDELFGKDEIVQEMDVSKRIESGFPQYLRTCISSSAIAESETPHPFDTHPPTAGRLAALGLDPGTALRDETLLGEVSDSWFNVIESAAELEGEQWREFEQAFHKFHEQTLAWRFLPTGPEETAHVAKFFPELRFEGKKGATAAMDFEKLHLSDWDAPLHFETISNCVLDDGIGKKNLTISYSVEGEKKPRTRKFCPADYTCNGRDLLDAFKEYYARHMTAKQHAIEKGAATG